MGDILSGLMVQFKEADQMFVLWIFTLVENLACFAAIGLASLGCVKINAFAFYIYIYSYYV